MFTSVWVFENVYKICLQFCLQFYNCLQMSTTVYTVDLFMLYTVESVVKYFDAKFARIWLIDREKKYLML